MERANSVTNDFTVGVIVAFLRQVANKIERGDYQPYSLKLDFFPRFTHIGDGFPEYFGNGEEPFTLSYVNKEDNFRGKKEGKNDPIS